MTADTPARQPHPQEYIITMGRIIKARNMLMVDGYHNADVLDRMVNLLRARPHTSPPAPNEQLQISDIIKDLEQSLKFYKDRVNMLQCWQSSMRDPERKIVCDILANGFTLTTKEEVDNAAKAAREQDIAKVQTKLNESKKNLYGFDAKEAEWINGWYTPVIVYAIRLESTKGGEHR